MKNFACFQLAQIINIIMTIYYMHVRLTQPTSARNLQARVQDQNCTYRVCSERVC
jgi:hypothetical protein